MPTFSALHPNYYPDHNFFAEFEPWKKQELEKGSPQNGVYKLRVKHPVSRLIGRDQDGVLYIGYGDVLGKGHRLRDLVNALNQVEFNHEAGLRYHYGKIPHRFPLTELIIDVELRNAAMAMAEKELQAYEYKFGELPPLNR